MMFVGIDVATAELVVSVRPLGDRLTATNDDRGVQTLGSRLGAAPPTLVVLEATGGDELFAVGAMMRLT